MSSKGRSIRRAAARAKAPENEHKYMSPREVLTSLSQRIHDQGRLIEELEKVVEEHEKKLTELMGWRYRSASCPSMIELDTPELQEQALGMLFGGEDNVLHKVIHGELEMDALESLESSDEDTTEGR